jgi:hypothetical protein
MNEPNWAILTLLGAIIGYIIPYPIKFFFFIIRRFQREILEGTWHKYHITIHNGTPRIEGGLWNIQKGLSSEYVVKESRSSSLYLDPVISRKISLSTQILPTFWL